MKKPALNDEQFMLEASQVADLYHQLTLDLFDQVIERIKERGAQSLEDNPYLWQAEKLQQMGLLNDENVKMIAERSGIAEEQLRYVLENEGLKIYEDTRQQITEATGKKGLVTDDSYIQKALSTYVNQAMFDIDNLINTTLPKSVIGAYQGIVEESVAKVVTGLSTHDQAINQTVMKWFEKGFYGFTDRGGKRWKADNYARTIIKSTAYRVKNEMRMRPAEELGIDTFYYSMKAAAREMCAPLQHQIVTTGNARTEKGIKIYALSDYGYGSPGGCQGINCGHTMTPFIPGVNRLPELNDELKDITPEKAIENANIQSKQRALEREIRHAKEQLHVANQLGDKELIDKYSAKVRSHQATMRAYIKRNPFLHRDYAREKIFEPEDVPYLKIKHKMLMNKIEGSVSEKQFWEHEDKKYYVDGKNVVLDYSQKEKDVAEWLAKKFGGHIELVPRVNYPKGISTPDYLINNTIKFDLKEITGSGKNVIDNNLKKSKKQSSNFIFDVTNANISEQELYRQIYNVYKSKRRNVDVIILKDGENVLEIIKKR
ncbi:capsid protein [Enterococcus cecorum]|uniref:phage minor capsid protein n=1 Tax=Enterococcus cecorum TaxID=44008 RepID=UPI001FADAA34|nr:phage minor capsid protein [Enterococcus cecorum]MCJ0572165.1 capsid protein [Enterococcus cecorum]MCJ0589943.1 capsid protein [Enterococcus cecorum]